MNDIPVTEPTRIVVVTPTYNVADYLQECFDSVAAQRGPGLEITHLVLDGGSSDETLEICANNDVVMVPRKPDTDLAYAMALGYDAAVEHGCDLIAYLGGDDIMLPGAMAAVAEVWREERKPMLFSRIRWTNGDMSTVYGELKPPPPWLSAKMHASFGWNYLAAISSFITPEGYQKVGTFNPDMAKTPDYEFWTRALHLGLEFSRVDHPTVVFRRHGGNDSMNFSDVYTQNLEYVMSSYGPKSKWERLALGYAFKAWVYGNHPTWSKSQFTTKLRARSLRGG